MPPTLRLVSYLFRVLLARTNVTEVSVEGHFITLAETHYTAVRFPTPMARSRHTLGIVGIMGICAVRKV